MIQRGALYIYKILIIILSNHLPTNQKAMKRYLVATFFAFAAICAGAVQARRGITVNASTPDGTEITLSRAGDEFFPHWVAADGTPYRILDDGSAEPLSASDLDAAARRVTARRKAMRPKASTPGLNRSQVPHTGTIRVPVLLVDYKDKKFRDGDAAKSIFTDFFQQGSKSARQYFIDNSNGRFTPEFDIYGPYSLSGVRSTYGANGRDGNDVGMGNMVGEACLGLDGQIDFSRYDNDGDGVCDVVIVLYAGEGEASSGVNDAIWPAQWALSYSEFGRSLRLDGVTVNDFAVFNELNGANIHNIDGIGTFCHEFSHCLGLPDFYDTTPYGSNYGMGPWSLMCYGSYNDNTYTPIGYSAYEKWFMGWIDGIEEPKPGATLQIPVFNSGDASKDVAYRLTSPTNDNEYFILENRARQGWDAYMPAEGLLIYHVDYDQSAWDDNSVNSYSPERMAVVAADDRRNDLTEGGDLFPYNTVNSFTDNTSPAACLNNGDPLRKPVTEITRDRNSGVISCRFMADALPELDPPAFAGENRPTETETLPTSGGFTAVWPAAATDMEVTYTLDVRPYSDKRAELLLTEDCTQDSYSWEEDGFVSPEDNSLHMGSGKNTGSLTSPVFSFGTADELSILFRAKTYGSDYGVSVRVCLLSATGAQLASQSVSISSGYRDFAVTVKGMRQGEYRVRLETIAPGKRINLKWIKVYSGDASDLLETQASRSATSNPATEVLTFTGLTSTSYRVEGLTPGGVYDYRVKVIPVDSSLALPSAWSEAVTVALPLSSAIEEVETDTLAPAEYFDLSGRRVANPSRGFYICRRGSSVTKVFIP